MRVRKSVEISTANNWNMSTVVITIDCSRSIYFCFDSGFWLCLNENILSVFADKTFTDVYPDQSVKDTLVFAYILISLDYLKKCYLKTFVTFCTYYVFIIKSSNINSAVGSKESHGPQKYRIKVSGLDIFLYANKIIYLKEILL